MVKKNAIFFDRDGVLINAPVDSQNKPKSIKKLEELKFTKNIIKTCKVLNKDYFLFMITNQPDFKRKNNTKKNINEINNYIKKKLNLKKIFVCFCDDDSCPNRKPNPGMIFKAKKIYNISLKDSYVVGDRWRDLGAGKKAGCKTIFINREYKEKNPYKADYTIKSIKKILNILYEKN
tara:strand:+ start:983 stop:1513 length:531 start_codon:yes stop_codon:yes gene_type:complete